VRLQRFDPDLACNYIVDKLSFIIAIERVRNHEVIRHKAIKRSAVSLR
jgi:hypothetical protein